jgi:glycosyltransferase involved in cell wall biosynthesis
MQNLNNGVSILICTYNGSKNLEQTLIHLVNQHVDDNIPWEVILIDNGSTDQSKETAARTWNDQGCPVPLRLFDEPKKGKDIAIDFGLSKVQYKYVIVCDDDNWLCDTYVQHAYYTMKNNPEIGILGGKSVAAFESNPPQWFFSYQIYFAVGEQGLVNGEIQHYWPKYRFLWGAGSVINMEAYFFLKSKGFSRILTVRKYPKVARSEDVELCFAIWLAGYKVWYQKELVLQHYISNDRLQWSYLMKVISQSVSSMHYLWPYQIFIFAGNKYNPTASLWLKHVWYHLKELLKNYRSFNNIKILLRLLIGRHIEDHYYFKKASEWYHSSSVLKLGRGYGKIFQQVAQLKKRLTY